MKATAHLAEQRFVAPEALNVAAPLIGQPLARPIRRALAMGLDLLVVALLSGVSGFWLLGGLAAVVLQLRNRRAAITKKRMWVGWALAGLLGLLALNEAKDQWLERHEPGHIAATAKEAAKEAAEEAAASAREAAADAAQEARDLGDNSADAIAARKAANAASAVANIANKLGAKIAVRQTDKGFTLASESAASAGVDSAPVVSPAEAASAALAAADEAARVARNRIHDLEAELAEAKKPKPFSLRNEFKRLVAGVGLQFGWGVVYFSLLPAWWGGQTVGKKVFGLKVVEITGKPMTVMRCLKRYGGYAAGMATGGLGFGQMLWDPNRQGIQDKAAHTVVLDLHALPVIAAATATTAPALPVETPPAEPSVAP